MTKSKVFSTMMNNMLSNFNGQFMTDTDLKTKFGASSSSVDSLLRVDRIVFLFAYKFDNGVMSANNITQFFRSCNVIINDANTKHPEKQYVFYKILVTKKPVSYPDMFDQNGQPKFYNLCLNPEDINDMIPETFDNELMDRLMMRVYNNVASFVNQYPGIKESNEDVRMTYYY